MQPHCCVTTFLYLCVPLLSYSQALWHFAFVNDYLRSSLLVLSLALLLLLLLVVFHFSNNCLVVGRWLTDLLLC